MDRGPFPPGSRRCRRCDKRFTELVEDQFCPHCGQQLMFLGISMRLRFDDGTVQDEKIMAPIFPDPPERKFRVIEGGRSTKRPVE